MDVDDVTQSPPAGNDVRIVAADRFSSEVVRRTLIAGFRGYPVPIEPTASQFAAMVAGSDIDLAASAVAVGRDGGPIGVALLAIRGSEAWCGGLGVAPVARRTGIGRRLMTALIAEARRRGLSRFRLEVIDGNAAARALYDALAFVPLRRLDVFQGHPNPAAPGSTSTARSITRLDTPDGVWADFCAYHPTVPAWQRDLPSLRYARRGTDPPAGFCLGDPGRPDAYLLVRRRGEDAVVLDAGCRRDAVDAVESMAALVRHLAAADPGCALGAHNIPEDDPLNAVLRAVGVPVVLTQTELALALRQERVAKLAGVASSDP